jgi:hypothetical protein
VWIRLTGHQPGRSRVAATLVLVDQRLVSAGKAGHPVNLAGEQAILRLVELDEVVENTSLRATGSSLSVQHRHI